jgi:hypothetical protein
MSSSSDWSPAKRAAVNRFMTALGQTSGQAALGLSQLLDAAESRYSENVCPECGGHGAELPNGVPYCNCEIPHAT